MKRPHHPSRLLLQWVAATGLCVMAGFIAAIGFANPAQYDVWDGLLKKHVTVDGGVNYAGMKADRNELKAFVSSFATWDTAPLSDKEKYAAYVNFYNALMIENLLRYAEEKKLDVASKSFLDTKINDIRVSGGNIWNGSYKAKLNGLEVNLDEIEHGLMRREAKGDLKKYMVSKIDPRLHAAVNCAAVSCPRVREKAYRGDTLDAMFQENMNEWLSREFQFAKLSDSKMKANSIVMWYYQDFEEHGKAEKMGGAGSYLATFVQDSAKDAAFKRKHMTDNLNGRSKLSLRLSSAFDFSYDWRVNDQKNMQAIKD